jgi:hypothetical protein
MVTREPSPAAHWIRPWLNGLLVSLLAGGIGVPVLAVSAHAQPPPAPPAAPTPPTKEKESDETRRLEAEVEQHPAPAQQGATSDVTQKPSPVSRIPEAIEPPKTAPPRSPAANRQPTAGRSSIEATLLDLRKLDARQVVQLQERLRGLGYYLGKIDGIVGPQTLNALGAHAAHQFAVSRRLLQDGQLTPELAPLVSPNGQIDDATP